jgi:hypothetical protein
MALIVKDRVKQSAAAPGTGTVTLGSTPTGFQSFAAVGNANTTYFAIVDPISGDWEVNYGVYTSSGTTLTRNATPLSSSNSGSLVNFTGAVDVFVTYPSEKAVYEDTAGVVTFTDNPILSAGTASGVTYLNGSKVLSSGSALQFNGTNQFTVLAATGTTYNRTESTQYSTFAQHFATSGGTGVEYKTLYRFVDTDAGEIMRLTSTSLYTASGINVGIGLNLPPQLLSLYKVTGGVKINFDRATNTQENSIVLNLAGANQWQFGTGVSAAGSDFEFYDYSGTAGTRLIIKQGGNVGIGTSSPFYRLDVGATSDVAIAMGNSTSVTSGNRGTLSMYNSAGSTVGFIRFGAVTDNSGTDIQFAVRPAGGSLNSTAMTLSSTGNLALGKTSASYRFDLQGAVGENQTLAGFFSGTNTARGLTLGLSAGGTAVNDAFAVYNATLGGGYSGHIWQAGGTEQARINQNGYFGIGQNNPQSILDISSPATVLRLASTTGTNSVYQRITNDGGQLYFGIDNSAGNDLASGSTAYAGVLVAPGTTRSLHLGTNGTVRATILSTGYFGIATNNPGATLDVKGSVNLTNTSNSSIFFSKGTSFGYSSSYPVVLIGGTSGSDSTVAIGYDPVINANGAFTGDGSELIFRNGIAFTTPNTANTGWNLKTLVLKDGNVGIGTDNTDPLSLARDRNLAIVSTSTSGALTIIGGNNARIDFGVGSTRTAGIYSDVGNFLEIFTTPALPIVFSPNSGEKMRITSAGNVGIGTNNPTSYGSTYRNLDVSGAVGAYIFVKRTDATAGTGEIAFDTDAMYVSTKTNHPMIFRINDGEKVRIDTSGRLLVGLQTTSLSAKVVIEKAAGSPDGMAINQDSGGAGISFYGSAATAIFCYFVTSSGNSGQISGSGVVTSYTSVSDYRLKNTIAPMTGALAKVALLKPCTYKWNADGSDGDGFIAHELAEVCPQAVTGEKDAVDANGKIKPQGVDTSFLVATLTAAIQEQQAIIESLKARLDAANL